MCPPPLTICLIIEGQEWSLKNHDFEKILRASTCFPSGFPEAMTLKIQDLHDMDQKLHAIDQHVPEGNLEI